MQIVNSDPSPPLWRRYLDRFQPREGWLSLFLLYGLILTMATAVTSVGWIDQLGHLIFTALLAAGITSLLAKANTPAWRAWLILLAWGGTITFLTITRFLPSPAIASSSRVAIQVHARQNTALTIDRLSAWWQAVSSGNSSSDPIGFAILITALAWLTACYLTWATFRQQKPLAALCICAVLLALNSYFSRQALNHLLTFVIMAISLIAYLQLISLEQRWEREEVDYSAEIRLDLTWTVLLISLALFAFSSLIPTLSIRRIASRVASSAIVQTIEESLDRAFDGINQASGGQNSVDGRFNSAARPRQASVLPSSYLLETPPSLLDTVVMTATIRGEPGAVATVKHLRGISYDIYTGRGWALSDERRAIVVADEIIVSTPVSNRSTLDTSITWLHGTRSLRFAPGTPQRFDSDTIAYWRGSSDISRIHGSPAAYQVQSHVSTATGSDLDSVSAESIPSLIAARYTELPSDLPDRIHDLAQTITADATTPHQQARAIEAFLHQYEYSLDVVPPPADVDVVDYFLFESQIGYCDFFASSMTVLARSIGLPARLAAGYYVTPSSQSGERQLRELDGHSWSEIYFAGYGWIGFEPTASFDPGNSAEFPTPLDPLNDIPIPDSAPLPPLKINTRWLLPAIGLSLLLFALLSRFGRPRPDTLATRKARVYTYARRLLPGDTASLTPNELASQLDSALEKFSQETPFNSFRIKNRITRLRAEIDTTVSAWLEDSYGRVSAELPPAKLLNRRFDWLLITMRPGT